MAFLIQPHTECVSSQSQSEDLMCITLHYRATTSLKIYHLYIITAQSTDTNADTNVSANKNIGRCVGPADISVGLCFITSCNEGSFPHDLTEETDLACCSRSNILKVYENHYNRHYELITTLRPHLSALAEHTNSRTHRLS